MNPYSSHFDIAKGGSMVAAPQVHVLLHKGMGSGRILSEVMREGFAEMKQEGANSIAFAMLGGIDSHETARAILRSVFAHLREGFGEKEYIFIECEDEPTERLFEDCYWDESLTLIGKREEREGYKYSIDNYTQRGWRTLFDNIPAIEKGEAGLEDHLDFCPNYSRWTAVFDRITPEDYGNIPNLYCLAIIATMLSRAAHRTGYFAPVRDVLAMYRALEDAARIYPYIFEFRVIAELHNRGYELLRLCPSLSPSGCSWRCIATTRDNTYEQCGAICANLNWGATVVNVSNGMLFKDADDGLDIPIAADRFCKEYPELVEASKGSDPEYKRWFRRALHLAQQGQIFYCFEDMCSCFHRGRMLGTAEPLPFPPAGTVKGSPRY